MRYNEEDLIAISKGEKTLEEIAEKYHVSKTTMLRALNRRGYFVKKRKIKIIAPYGTEIVFGIQECADALLISTTSVKKALKGERIKVLDAIGIRLEEIP